MKELSKPNLKRLAAIWGWEILIVWKKMKRGPNGGIKRLKDFFRRITVLLIIWA